MVGVVGYVLVGFGVHGVHSGPLSKLMVAGPGGSEQCANGQTGVLDQDQIADYLGTGFVGMAQSGYSDGYVRCWTQSDGTQVTAVVVRFTSAEYATDFAARIVGAVAPDGGANLPIAHGATLVSPPADGTVSSETVVSKGDIVVDVTEVQPGAANPAVAQGIAEAIYQKL